MAITVKYRMDWKDQFQGDDFRADFEMEYGESVIGLGHTVSGAFELNYNEGDSWVVGSEAVMSFFVSESDKAAYDADFYDSNYKDIKVKYYVNSVLKWVGWLKPENTTRDFLSPELQYRISATDGLNDLKDVDYTGFETTGKETGLQLIKNALNFNGIDDLDIYIQCNLYEDILMSAGENVFAELQGNNSEFYTVEDGESKPDKCYTVLEKVIKPYYCQLSQVDGYWQIINGQEYSSEFDIFDYATLTQNTGGGGVNRSISITNYYRPSESKFELSKNPTLKNLRILFRNKNLGENEIGTNPDFEDGGTPPAGWSNSGWDSFSTTTLADGDKVGNTTESSTNADSKFITAASFTLSGVNTEQDSVLTSFKVKIKSITFSSPGERVPVVYAELVDPNSDTVQGNLASLSEVDGEFVTIEDSFPVTIDGVYSLRLYVVPHATSPTSQLTYYWNDVFASHSTTANTTTDSLYVGNSSVAGYKEIEEEIFFADSLQNSDIGALNDGTTLTKSWTRFGESAENQSLAYLFIQQYLNDRQAYHDLLVLDLYDIDETINFNSILTFDSKSYKFSDYSKNSKTKLISGTLRQVNNSSDISFTFQPQSLLSAFGKSSQTVEFDTAGFATQAWALSQFGSKGQTEDITGFWDFTNGSGLQVGGEAFTSSDIQGWKALDAGGPFQPADDDLTTIAGLAKTLNNFIVADGANWTLETPAQARTSMALLSMAQQAAGSVAITGGNITGLTNFAVGLSSFRANHVNFKSIQWFEGGILFNDNVSSAPQMDLGNNAYFHSGGTYKYISTDEAELFSMVGGEFYWYGAISGTAGNDITFELRMKLDSDGKLHVKDDIIAFSTSI